MFILGSIVVEYRFISIHSKLQINFSCRNTSESISTDGSKMWRFRRILSEILACVDIGDLLL